MNRVPNASCHVGVLALLFAAGCNSPDDLSRELLSRTALRSDAVGCWSLSTPIKTASYWIRLDSVVYSTPLRPRGWRHVRRLDRNGNVLSRDLEGFEVMDAWAADSLSDSIRIEFNNGLYGSIMMLELPATREPANRMAGHAEAFTDEYPPPNSSVRSVKARRTTCR